jgi:hypothetical protein
LIHADLANLSTAPAVHQELQRIGAALAEAIATPQGDGHDHGGLHRVKRVPIAETGLHLAKDLELPVRKRFVCLMGAGEMAHEPPDDDGGKRTTAVEEVL